jgi:hypothetical protein
MYFSRDAELNPEGPMLLEQLPAPSALGPLEVDWLRRQGALVLDTRTSTAFGTGHIPGALHIGLGGQFASWAGTLRHMGLNRGPSGLFPLTAGIWSAAATPPLWLSLQLTVGKEHRLV